jgi:glycosyltransferase involved in cell wall biosynthesis
MKQASPLGLSSSQPFTARQGNRPLRVLHFLCTPNRAGVGEHALSLLIALRKHGFIPYIVAPAPLLEAAKAELDANEITRVAMDMSSPLDWRQILRLSRLLRRERIDIIHCHMAIASFCASPAARWSGVPVVIETTHGREIWREGKCFKGSFWVDRQIGRFIDKFIAVSDAVAKHLEENKRIARRKIIVIQNGRDLSQFKPATSAGAAQARADLGLDDQPVILMLSRLSTEKGHALLIDAMRLLVRRWPQLVLLLAGDGPEEAAIKTQCTYHGLTGNVRFLGYRADAQRLFAAADVIAMPSKIEGLPLVAVEALASGRPVVATAVGGTPEVVIHEETGLLVSPDDSVGFAHALDRLLSDADMRARFGIRGRALVEGRYDVRTQVDRTMTLYWQLYKAARKSFERAAQPSASELIAPVDSMSSPADNSVGSMRVSTNRR